jgi:hypothetical protein
MRCAGDLTAYRNAVALVGNGCSGPIGATGPAGPTISFGNVAIVDLVYGDNSKGSIGGAPFKTIVSAISAATGVASSSNPILIWLMAGIHTLTSGITLPNYCSIRGLSVQACTLQLQTTTSASLLTMGEYCRVEDVTINLTCTGSTDNLILEGIVFGGTSSQTSKLRVCVINVNNSTMGSSLTNTVTGVKFSGTGSLNASVFSFNSIKGSTINVLSNGKGDKRGILVSGSNQMSSRDTNVYVAAPTNTSSTGSYIGVETADATNIGSAQLRTTTVGIVYPSASQAYTASDILQSNPSIISDPTYLASPGIQIGPGTDLVTKSAGGKGFSSYVYPTTIYYGLRGNISSAPNGYLWPGTQAIAAGSFPDTGLPAAYYRMQQPALLSGMSASLNAAPGGTNTVTLTVYYLAALSSSSTAAIYTGYISTTTLTVSTGPSSGSLAVGQLVSGPGVALNTYIVSGSGSSWTVYPSQTIGSSGTPIAMTNGTAASVFTGTIAGTTLTVSSVTSGIISIGQYLAGTGITAGTTITAGSGVSWTVSTSQNVGPITMTSVGLISTPYTLTFGATDTQQSFYNASVRLNSGDRISVYLAYTSGSPSNAAHDISVQLDFF